MLTKEVRQRENTNRLKGFMNETDLCNLKLFKVMVSVWHMPSQGFTKMVFHRTLR